MIASQCPSPAVGAPRLRSYIHASAHAPPRRGVLACVYHSPTLPSSLGIAQRTRAHFTPQHWLLCHLGMYY